MPRPMDVVELTKELVAIESVTLREGRVVAHLKERLTAAGWKVLTQPIEGGDPSVPGERANILAVDDDTRPPRLVLTTHLDTVPPFIPPREDDTHVYGRGTCDAKGIFAAEWLAAEELRRRGHKGIALLGVVGEETDSIGAKRVKQILPSAGFIVDGEPTGMLMTSAAKGILSLKLTAKGVAGHSAYPERGKSATHTLISGLARVLATELPHDPAIGPTTANVGRIEGGVAPNVIAPEARAELMIRLAAPIDMVRGVVERLLGPEIEHEINTQNEPLKIYAPEGFPSAPVSFGSDVPYLSPIGTTLLVGPGSIHDAHTAGEKIGKDELRRAVDFYVALGERLLASTS
jgi:acetylornithine deacetylase